MTNVQNHSPRNTFKVAFFAPLAVLAGLATSGAANAGDDNGLYACARAADNSVDEVMVYPGFAAKRSQSGRSVYEVTVDRSGNLVDADLIESAGHRSLRTAARKVVEQAEFPALPSDYRGDHLTFSLRLNYIIAGSDMEARALKRRTRVESETISSGQIASGSILITTNSGN